MQIEYTGHFRKHGCNFRGELAVVDYSQEIDKAGWGQGSGVVREAEELVKGRHPNCTVLLSMPTLVVELPELNSNRIGKAA